MENTTATATATATDINNESTLNINSTRGKSDVAWGHCEIMPDPKGKNRVILKCNYCQKVYQGGGIHRMKEHLAGKKGDAKSCKGVPSEVRYEIECSVSSAATGKKRKYNGECVVINDEDSEEEEPRESRVINNGKKLKGKKQISSYFAPRTTPGAQPGIKSVLASRDKILEAHLAIGRWMYDACIPFNAVNSYLFQPMIDAVASIGPGYKGPSYYDIRGPVLEKSVQSVMEFVETFRGEWREKGCTLMADGWKDKRSRTLINFLVYCPKGTVFLKSVDASEHSKTALLLFGLFKEVIDFVGAKNVVQMVTDNAANYRAAGRMLAEEYPHIFFSSCVAHCIDLMLEDFDKFVDVKRVIDTAREVTKFVYNHTHVVMLMRKKTKGRELIRPAATRFATNFLTLQSLINNKNALQHMVTCNDWLDSPWPKHNNGKKFKESVLSSDFWSSCDKIVRIGEPLVKILRMVDSDERPAMGYVFEGMRLVRVAIKRACKNRTDDYGRFLDIIDARWENQLHAKLHTAGYWLNPEYFYNKKTFNDHHSIFSELLDCIEKMYDGDFVKQEKINEEIVAYREAAGDFGRIMAKNARASMLPANWWKNFGGSAPNLQEMAIRILSQTCSSSGCERNWSVFERIHTDRRNRLEHQRLNDLVYVQTNLRLANPDVIKKKSYDPISFEEMELVGEWVIEDASPLEENLQENEVAENWSTTNEVPIVDQTYEEMGMMELLRTMEQGQQPFTSQDDADDMHCS